MPLFKKQSLHPGYIASRRYPLAEVGNGSAAIAAVDVIYFLPFVLKSPLTATKFSIYVATGGAASSAKFGIWANSPISIRPLGAPLVADNTGVATTSSGINADFAATAITLAPGLYWGGIKATGTLPTVIVQAPGQLSAGQYSGVPTASLQNAVFYSSADAYANSMPTFAEGASFTAHTSSTPVLFAVT
jgi:hypothetical protein